MWRHAGPRRVRLDIVGDGLQMKCEDLTHLRGSIRVVNGTAGAAVVGFKFSCDPSGAGVFVENGTADRLSSIGTATISSSAISCTGFAQVRMEVVTASATTDTSALFDMFSYTPNTALGEIRDQGVQGYGEGVNDNSQLTEFDDTRRVIPQPVVNADSGNKNPFSPDP